MPTTLTTEEFVQKAKQTHKNTYNYSYVRYKGALKKVIITCLKHGDFKQTASGHLFGKGCPKCGGTYKKTTKDFIQKAEEIHSDRYDYSKIRYKGSRIKVTIICKEHGSFNQTPSAHLQGSNCPKCAIINIIKKLQKSPQEFIRQATKIHKNKYNYSKIEYINANTKITIICPIHEEFSQIASRHLNGHGCPKCGDSRLTVKQFIRRARRVHGHKYFYSKVQYKNSLTKIIIICRKHGNFLQIPNNHLRGHGCSKCAIEKY